VVSGLSHAERGELSLSLSLSPSGVGAWGYVRVPSARVLSVVAVGD